MYGMPTEIDVQADGALRIITLNRPDALNAVNDPLHCGLARLWDELSEDQGARAAVLTGAGRSRQVVISTTSMRSVAMMHCAPRRSSTVAISCSG